MPPAYVKPYVKRQKNDSADAEAICEAVTRANIRFVATKTTEQQSPSDGRPAGAVSDQTTVTRIFRNPVV